MKIKILTSLLLTAAVSSLLTAAEAAAPQKNAAKAKAKAKAKVVRPADGGMKAATTAQPRQDPNAAKKGTWHKYYDAKRKQLAKQKNDIQIVFIGDSITHFWNRKPNTGKNPKAYGGDATFKKYFGNYRLLNLGYSGDRTNHTLWIVNESEFLNNIKPQLVVVMIGTNNFGGRNPMAGAPATAEAIKLIVQGILKKQPETHVLLFGIFPRGAKAKNGFRNKISQTNAIISKLADDKNVFYCDITDKLLEKDGTLSQEMMCDYLHPGEKGYEIWAQAIMPYVKRFVDNK